MKKLITGILALILPLAPLAAQDSEAEDDVFDRGCGDDNGVDRCDPEIQAKMRAAYGWKSAEKLVEEGTSFRRIMFVDGYGRDVGGIMFSREVGQSPRVRISPVGADSSLAESDLSAAMSQAQWDSVISNSAMFDQTLAREINDGDGDSDIITMCLHGWFIVAEAGDAARLQPNLLGQSMQKPVIRRDAEGSCANGLAVPYAFNVAESAWSMLPECHSLPRDSARNIAQLLVNCAQLGGDRLEASDALRFKEELVDKSRGSLEQKEVKWLLATTARELEPQLTNALASGDWYLGLPNASDADHASVKGSIIKRANGKEGTEAEIANISLQLIRQAGEFVVLSFQVSEFRDF